MQINKDDLQNVEIKLNQQNALKAAIAASVWSIPTLIAWYYLFHNFGQIAPTLLFVSGAVVGFAVRFYGKGVTPIFSVLAVLTHFLLVVSAAILALILAPGEQIWAVFLLALYAGGAWISAYIARKPVPLHESRAFIQLTELNEHPSNKAVRNRWFVCLPVSFLCAAFLLWVTLSFIYVFDAVSTEQERIVKQEQRLEKFEAQAIEVSINYLTTLSNKDALLHAYAFHSGVLYNDDGYQIADYPLSNYKAQTILKFLASERNLSRAKFILGILTFDANGLQLIQEASAQGDRFARIFATAQLGCSRPKDAEDLLQRFYDTATETIIRQTIYFYISDSFEEACARDYQPPFLSRYVIYYQ